STCYVDLTIDYAGNSIARDYTLRRNLLTGLPGAVAWNSNVIFTKFQINGGSGGNQFLVQSTPNTPVTLNTGNGSDRVFVQTTAASLNINGQNGNDAVDIGKTGDVRSITGQVTISNVRGYTGVIVDASADTTQRTVILYKDKKNYNLSGLTPSGDIVMVGTDVNSLQVSAGSGGNTFRIHDTPGDAPGVTTTIALGTGSDSVRVNGTSGDLILNTQTGQNNITVGSETTGMNKIQGVVSVIGQGIVDNLTIDDRASKASDTYTHTITTNSYGRSAAAPVFFTNIWAFQLQEGKATDTTNIQGNPTAPYFFGFNLYAGAGNDIVNIGNSANQLVGLSRLLVDGQAGSDTINMQDQGRTTPDAYRMGFEFGAATSPYISSEQMTLQYSGTEKLLFLGGSGGNTVRVEDLAGSLMLTPGSGNDLIEVGNTSNMLTSIASLRILDTGGDDQLILHDDGTVTNRHYEISGSDDGQGAVKSRASRFIGPIRFDQNVLFDGMESITLNAGTGNDYLNIRSTPGGVVHGLQVNAGPGGDSITLGTGYAVDANGRPVANSLSALWSPVTVEGQDGIDTIQFDDQDTGAGQTFLVSTGLVRRTGIAPVQYGSLEELSIRGGLGDDVFRVIPGTGPAQSLDGGLGNNSLDYSGTDVDPGSIPGGISRYLAENNFQDVYGINPGTPQNGVTFGTGRNGQAFQFDGLDDYVDLGTDPSFNVQGSLSVSVWVSMDTLDHYKYLLADFDPSGGYSQGSLGILDDRTLFWFQSTDEMSSMSTGSTTLEDGQWYHLAAVRDDIAKTITLYVNGVVDGTMSYTGTPLPLQGSKLIGTSLPALFPGDFFQGRMDEVSIFNRALTTTEVQALAGSGGWGGTSEDVEVNLVVGTATGFSRGIRNINNVTGGSGNDILVGNGGNILNGSRGRDLLIAGRLASTLVGNEGDDLLIAGTTNYDTNASALRAIRAEWGREASNSERVSNLTTSNGVNVPKLTSATVRTNGGGNILLGGNDADLFFCLLASDINDREANESLVSL
ncbi:MAG TPA: hypothetical protein PLX97_00010, partial [Gemmatales bacterium]|nr:hypothetical protein [Gemmatales bacterium]